MDLRLKNKIAVVCASSEGIGKGIARSLSREQVKVCLVSRSEEKLKKAAFEIEAASKNEVIFKVCDLQSKKDIRSTYEYIYEALGPIDILINNQGGPTPGELLSLDEKDIESAIQVNFKSIIEFSKMCLPSMLEKKWGRIVNVLSLSAKEPMKNMLLSNSLRPAVLGVAKSLANQYAASGITVNSVLPNAVLSKRTEYIVGLEAERLGVDYESCLKKISEDLPIGRIAEIDEIGDIVTFLCSDRAGYLNGLALPIDGGASRGLL